MNRRAMTEIGVSSRHTAVMPSEPLRVFLRYSLCSAGPEFLTLDFTKGDIHAVEEIDALEDLRKFEEIRPLEDVRGLDAQNWRGSHCHGRGLRHRCRDAPGGARVT